jgi:hypothetical protein
MKRSLVFLAGVVLLILLAIIHEVPRMLLFGWLLFLARVLSRLSVDWGVVAVSCTALVLFTAGIHWIGRSWRRSTVTDSSATRPRWKIRWSLALVAVLFLLFTIGVCMIGITHQVSWLLSDPQPLFGSALKYREISASRNNLREIGHAMGNYQSSNGTFPVGGSFTPNGEMLHSWETLLLPYVGYVSNEIDLQVAWNHPRNAQFFKTVPVVYINPDYRTPPLWDADGFGLSHYAANSHVLAANKSMKEKEFINGATNTLLVGEVNTGFMPWGHPVNWRDPAKGINKSADGFGGPMGSVGAQFVMADGSVRFLNERVAPEVLRALSAPNGGERIDLAEPGPTR